MNVLPCYNMTENENPVIKDRNRNDWQAPCNSDAAVWQRHYLLPLTAEGYSGGKILRPYHNCQGLLLVWIDEVTMIMTMMQP